MAAVPSDFVQKYDGRVNDPSPLESSHIARTHNIYIYNVIQCVYMVHKRHNRLWRPNGPE